MHSTIIDFNKKLEETSDILDKLHIKLEEAKDELQSALTDKEKFFSYSMYKRLNRANEIFNRYNDFKEWLNDQLLKL